MSVYASCCKAHLGFTIPLTSLGSFSVLLWNTPYVIPRKPMNITINILWLLPVMSVCTSLGVVLSAVMLAGKGSEVDA